MWKFKVSFLRVSLTWQPPKAVRGCVWQLCVDSPQLEAAVRSSNRWPLFKNRCDSQYISKGVTFWKRQNSRESMNNCSKFAHVKSKREQLNYSTWNVVAPKWHYDLVNALKTVKHTDRTLTCARDIQFRRRRTPWCFAEGDRGPSFCTGKAWALPTLGVCGRKLLTEVPVTVTGSN